MYQNFYIKLIISLIFRLFLYNEVGAVKELDYTLEFYFWLCLRIVLIVWDFLRELVKSSLNVLLRILLSNNHNIVVLLRVLRSNNNILVLYSLLIMLRII